MEQRNWQVWLAIALGGLALIVALSGRSAPIVQNYGYAQARPAVDVYVQPPQAPQAPQPPQPEQPDRPGAWHYSRPSSGGDSYQEFRGPAAGHNSYREYYGSGDGREGPFVGMHEREGFRGGPFGHRPFFFGPFVLISILFRIVGIGVLLFLLVRFFKKQKASATPPASS